LRDHLTAVVSHDLRTPLAGLQGYLEMLRDDDLDSPLARRMLERSWMLTRRLTLLTEDLLSSATLEHGDLVVTPEVLELNQQLVECATCFPDLDLEVDCPPGLAAYADSLRLQQILANLVRNAQKHGAEPVRITAAPDPARGQPPEALGSVCPWCVTWSAPTAAPSATTSRATCSSSPSRPRRASTPRRSPRH
jgi:signal transduction histidine kinase